MGRGKRIRNHPLPPRTATDHGATPPPDDHNPNNQEYSNEIHQFTKIESECQAAIAAHLGGNHAEAISLINEALVAHDNTGVVHATLCRLHHLEASRVGPSAGPEFQNLLRSAVGSAKRAASLSPASEEFGTLYGEAMYKLASEVEGFDEVVGACEQALSKVNALKHSNDASLVFKALTEETDSQSLKGKQDCSKVKTSNSRMYWDEMSGEKKMGMIEVRIRDLKEYCRKLGKKNGLVERVFSEGVGYAAKNKNWKFFHCYFCDEKFQDFELRVEHIEREHKGVIGQYVKITPFLVDADGAGSEVYDIFLLKGDVFMTDIERVVFTGDLSRPLNDRLLRVEVEYGSASTEASVLLPPDIEGFTKWLFDYSLDSTAEELGEQWTELLDRMKREGLGLRVRFDDEFSLFENLRRKQSELVVHCRSLRLNQIVCAEELWNRKEDGNHVHRKYESLLKKLVDYDSPTRASQLKAVVAVMNEARDIRQLNDPNSTDVEDQEDVSIRMAIRNQLDQALSELCTNEEQLTRSNGVLWWLLVIYKQASLDYRVITVPLVRNFIRAKLEALAFEEAQQKSDAVYAELFSEFSLDTKKSTSKGNSDPKHSKKTSKANKKNKHHRDSKASSSKQPTVEQEDSSSQQPTVEQEDKAEQVYSPDAEEMKLEVDEARQMAEALRKKLEAQRQFEDEAKQKALGKEATNKAAPMDFRALFKP